MSKRDVSFTYLQYFHDAARHESVSAAARENFVSQSAISQGIAKLEAALQTQLTTHQKQQFRLTEQGAIVFDEAKRLFSNVDQLKERLNALKGEISGTLKFSSTNSLAQFFLPYFYVQMKNLYPTVNLKFHRGSLNYIHESLRNEMSRFALALDGVEFEGYNREVLAKGYFRLYKKKDVSNSHEILVDHLENYEVKELRERYKKRYAEEISIKDTLSGWGIVLSFVILGYGVGYLPEFMAQNNPELEEVLLDIRQVQYAICAIYPRGMVLTRSECAFLDLIKNKINNY